MTLERIEELWSLRGYFNVIPRAYKAPGDYSGSVVNPRGVTKEENAEVLRVWKTMPGNTCWMDAFHKLWRTLKGGE